MDNQIKSGAKVWVLCEVVDTRHLSRVSCKYGPNRFRALVSDCKPVEPELDSHIPKEYVSVVDRYSELVRSQSDFAWTIFCNLAIMAKDAGAPHKESNERAADLMKNWFGVNVRKLWQWQWQFEPIKPKPVEQKVNKQETSTLNAKKFGWYLKKGDWVTITKPTDGDDLGWVSPSMDKYDGKTFQFEGEFSRVNKGRLWPKGPEGYYFNLAWLKPWKPKSGDWVTITRPEDTEIEPGWATSMDVYLGKPQMLHSDDFNDLWYLYDSNEPEGSSYCFDLKWLSPAEAPKAENKNLQPACVSKVDDVVNESQSTLATVDAPEIDSSMRQLNWNDTVQPGDLILNVETQYVVFAACSVGLKVDDAFFEAKKAGITRLFYRPIKGVPFND